jgi:DNA-binding PadR family transcriptional regulator
LSLPWVHILLALAGGERHGYGIMQDVDGRTEGHVRLWPATLYGAIRRMLAAGLIEEASPPTRPDSDDQRRKYYRLTDSGRRVLARETERLAELVETARQRDVLDTPKPV